MVTRWLVFHLRQRMKRTKAQDDEVLRFGSTCEWAPCAEQENKTSSAGASNERSMLCMIEGRVVGQHCDKSVSCFSWMKWAVVGRLVSGKKVGMDPCQLLSRVTALVPGGRWSGCKGATARYRHQGSSSRSSLGLEVKTCLMHCRHEQRNCIAYTQPQDHC